MANGVPRSTVYGGTTYSSLFGNQDCSATDFGWMQGYDKWYEAMHNRISHNSFLTVGVDTPEGRDSVKRWLWNHWGDTSYAVGGIAGIGVASACKQADIADDSTGVNRAAGVVGKKYVTRWGDGVDHALTIVGYDDRLLFDLDGNGVLGEPDKDERGAWIIVNSWGSGWANKGFIYCPYKYGSPVRQGEGGYWKPEFYHVRKDYRPLRTLKILMDYSRRSELKLRVGIAKNLQSDTAEHVVDMEHFKFAGDGRWNKEKQRYGGLEAATPMLGRWADGKLHSEPMEFGYDLTDLAKNFDTSQPLKYFFIIETRDKSIGHGKLRRLSVIDYAHDSLGIETPFALEPRGTQIRSGGDSTVLSVVVQPLRSSYSLSAATPLSGEAARFALSSFSPKVGERLSFLPLTPQLGLRYAWNMPGAAVDTATTLNAAAVYSRAGRYKVDLKVTHPVTGKTRRQTLRFNVENIVPEAAFRLSRRVIKAGERVELQDASRYAPEAWAWQVTTRKRSFEAEGRKVELAVQHPGVYDVTLRATNEKGSHCFMQPAALIVTAADSRNGLLFSRPESRVTASLRSSYDSLRALTLSWWMNPEKGKEAAGISVDDKNGKKAWQVRAASDGRLEFAADSVKQATAPGFVVPGEWHHYAVVFTPREVKFMRDAELVSSHGFGEVDALAAAATLTVGGAENPMRAAIDEFRIYHSSLHRDTIALQANKPLTGEDLQYAEKRHALRLYYDFNQSGGDVEDRGSGAQHAVRHDFGPDGDAWGLSQGVFCLDTAQPVCILTDSLLPPSHKAPFAADTVSVNSSDRKRFLAFRANECERGWYVENTIGSDSIRTGVHVDRNKHGALTVTTGWDGFASMLHNHKLYTVLRLPAGRYEFRVLHGVSAPVCGRSLIVASPGKGIAETESLIASSPLADGHLAFTLREETTLSLGVLFNLGDRSCIPIHSFELVKYE